MLKGYNPGGVELQSTSLIRGKTGTEGQWKEVTDHFNPLPSSEGRRRYTMIRYRREYFNPLPSSEGRPHPMVVRISSKLLQSTSLIRGKTELSRMPSGCDILQSTSLIRGKTGSPAPDVIIPITSIHFPHPREDHQTGDAVCSS